MSKRILALLLAVVLLLTAGCGKEKGPTPNPGGQEIKEVRAVKLTDALEGDSWQPMYTMTTTGGYDLWITAMPRLLRDGTLAFPAIEGDYEDGKPIAVVLLRPDGSRETVNTPLTCGEWLVNGYGADKTQWVTDTCNKGDSMLLRTEYMTDIGTGNPWMRIDRIVEVEVWSDGRMESRDYTPEGDPDLTVTSPDGKHTANTTPDYSLQIDGTVVLQSEPDANIYYEPKLWLDNDRLVLTVNGALGRVFRWHDNDFYVYSRSTGEISRMNLAKTNEANLYLPRLMDGKLCWYAHDVYYGIEQENTAYARFGKLGFYSIPVEELQTGIPDCAVTAISYPTFEYDGRLWAVNDVYDWTTDHSTTVLKGFEPASGKSAELTVPVEAIPEGERPTMSRNVWEFAVTEAGAVFRITNYMGQDENGVSDYYGTDWLLYLPKAMIDGMQWQELPGILEEAEEIPLQEVEEIFGGRWVAKDSTAECQLTIYREGDALYCRYSPEELPRELVSAYRLGETGYHIITRREGTRDDMLELDTGAPGDGKITAMLEMEFELNYAGGA